MQSIKRTTIVIFKAVIFSMMVVSHSLSQSVDTILYNGNILTADKEFNVVEALAITDGRISSIASSENIKELADTNTHMIDLEGRTVLPGLIDNHLHFIRGVWNAQYEVRFGGIKSREEALNLLKAKVATSHPDEWITVMGGWILDQFLDDTSGFTLAELDEIAPENPIFLMRNYSNGFANSKAFNAIDVSSNGSATISGRNGISPFVNAVSWRNKSSSPEAILSYMEKLNQLGLTTVYDVGRPSEGSLEPLEELAENQQLPLRVFHTLRYSARNEEGASQAVATIEGDEIKPLTNDLQFGLIGLGEHIYVPVSDNPMFSSRWSNADWQPFTDISFAAAQNGWPVHEHVMSQATAEQYLDLVEDISKQVPTLPELKWTFAHANGMRDEDIARAADLGIVLAVHSQARMSARGGNAPRIGSIARSGALWGLGSDAGIVAPANPFFTLEWVIAGTNIAYQSAWSEDQRVSRQEALIAHTRHNAEMLFLADDLGSLEVGKLADLIVIDKDYMTIEPNEISTIRPVLTITNGNIVYEKME